MSLFCIGFRGTTDFFKRIWEALLFLSLSFFSLSLSFYEPPWRRKATVTGETGHKGDHSARVSSDHFFNVILVGGIFFFFFVSLPPLPQLALSFFTVCWASSPIHDRLTRGKEREGRKEISVFPPQLYAAWFYL